MTDTEPFKLPVRVYYEDTDAQGVVYYANYLRFMERARTEWLRSLGIDMARLQDEERRIFVVAEVQMKFHVPARLADEAIERGGVEREVVGQRGELGIGLRIRPRGAAHRSRGRAASERRASRA